MSASKPTTRITNPATKFISWKGGDEQGFFEYYDKDTKENYQVDISGFVICDQDLFSIKGWDDVKKHSLISNEVREVDDQLVIKFYAKNQKPVVGATGSYTQLKDWVRNNDGKYTKSIYARSHEGELIHIALSGAALSKWFEVSNDPRCNNSHIKVTGVEKGKKGNVKFLTPIFEIGEVASEQVWNDVLRIDSQILQPYLEAYLSKKGVADPDGSEKTTAAPTEFDSSKWRGYKTPNGQLLGELSANGLREIQDRLVDEGDVDSNLYEAVSHALYDLQTASKEWRTKEASDGRKLGDFSIEEIKTLLDKVPPNNIHRIHLVAAEDALKAVDSYPDFGDDDDIPF